jgi:4-hydroxy-tetrahydrodipicolinate synthase
MADASSRFGLSVALSTPVGAAGRIEQALLVEHARACLAGGCSSVTLFGTTGEGASFGLESRRKAVAALAGAVDARRELVVGLAASSLDDAGAQARMALDAGCRALLVPPPFYFKDVSDDGLFGWYAALIEGLGGAARDIMLYHIPGVTAVPISVELIGRLKRAFPGIVTGVKDSSCDRAHMLALLEAHRDLVILIGDERLVAEGVRNGASGTICGIANVAPELLVPVAGQGREEPRLADIVGAVMAYNFVPAIKAILAHRGGDRRWLRVAPPLEALSDAQARQLGAAFDGALARRAA